MDIELLKKSGIDYDAGIINFFWKSERYEKYLNKFFDDPHFEMMKDEMQKQNYTEVFRLAHAVKGMAGTLKVVDFYNAISELVELVRDGIIQNKEEVKEKYNLVLRLYDTAYGAVKGGTTDVQV